VIWVVHQRPGVGEGYQADLNEKGFLLQCDASMRFGTPLGHHTYFVALIKLVKNQNKVYEASPESDQFIRLAHVLFKDGRFEKRENE
jgi:hypothetical protein